MSGQDQRAKPAATAEGRPAWEGWVVFSISGNSLDPDALSRELGIEADRVRRPGPATGQLYMWQLYSDLPAGVAMEEHFWQVFGRIREARQKLRLVARRGLQLEFFCTMQKDPGTTLPLTLSPRLMLFLGHLGATLEVDVRTRAIRPEI